MLSAISQQMADYLIENKVIVPEDKPIYIYGIEQVILIGINICTTLVLGMFFNKLLASLIFMMAYIPLRSYAGGYHAKTRIRCYLFSVGMLIVCFMGIDILGENQGIGNLLLCIALGIIVTLVPVQDTNKPLSLNEKRVFKKIALIILSLLLVMMIMFSILGNQEIVITLKVVIISVGVMVTLGQIKNYIGVRQTD